MIDARRAQLVAAGVARARLPHLRIEGEASGRGAAPPSRPRRPEPAAGCRSAARPARLSLDRLLGDVARDQRGVEAAALEQLLVRAALDDPPWSSTTIWSASRIVDRRWAIVIVVRPSARRSSSACTAASVWVSSELVASSSTSTGGLRRIVRAIAIRCFSPPEKR